MFSFTLHSIILSYYKENPYKSKNQSKNDIGFVQNYQNQSK